MRAFYKNSQVFWRKVKMPSTLIVYSSVDGHTKKICDKIEMTISKSDQVDAMSIDDALNKDLTTYDKIIIGASIRYGRHSAKVYEFIEKKKNTLNKKKSAFFSVNVVARKPEKSTPETNPYIRKFLKKSSWVPKKLGVFAGKIDYPKLGFINKSVIRLIMFITSGPTNINNTYEFTDWHNVKKFINEFDEM